MNKSFTALTVHRFRATTSLFFSCVGVWCYHSLWTTGIIFISSSSSSTASSHFEGRWALLNCRRWIALVGDAAICIYEQRVVGSAVGGACCRPHSDICPALT
ncbi:unnamed protein product [Prorocentrum cordatum]|uniref:Secreted protein n=1 Tax=Prorocentrum cordatum TaxID=2364126 RepID=A0ABN9UQA0_9DINO|nr:unnamed protein product [Polarella glacialis]